VTASNSSVPLTDGGENGGLHPPPYTCRKSTGAETGRALFLYTPAKAGGLIEEQQRTGRKFASMTETELAEMLQRHGWELLGPSPL
jgi:hypothetical protein